MDINEGMQIVEEEKAKLIAEMDKHVGKVWYLFIFIYFFVFLRFSSFFFLIFVRSLFSI